MQLLHPPETRVSACPPTRVKGQALLYCSLCSLSLLDPLLAEHDFSISDRPTSLNLRVLGRLLGFAKPHLGRAMLAVLALVIGSGAVLAFGLVLRLVIDRGLADGDASALNLALGLLLLVIAVMAVAVALRLYLVTWIGERVVADVRRAVFTRVLRLDPSFFEVTRTGEVISRLTTDTSLVQVVVGSTLAIAMRNFLLFCGGLTLLAITSPKLTFWVMLGVPLVFIPIWILGRRVRDLSRQSQDRVADVGAYIDETLYGIRTVQAFCREAVDTLRYGQQVEGAFQAAVNRTRVSALLSALVMLLVFTAIALVLWVGGHDVLAGRMTHGQLAAFVFYAVLVAGAVGALSEVIGELLRAAGAAERLIELLDTEPTITSPAMAAALPVPAAGKVEFDNVVFRYASRPDSPALDGIHLTLAPGEKLALVGPSGAGKSTLLQLLLRFYDPESGVIRFDGVDLRCADLAQLRQRMALVPQDPVIFGASAWENIAFGQDNASADAVRAAAEAAYASEFLDRLPDGFDSHLGERGVRLSGGQRQRIAIARAILRDPALLLLDEATSALDAESERLVQEALERLMQNRSTLIIAHRLATVRQADRIIVMDQGCIVATGSHDQLIAQGGLYARLAELQFRDLAA
ncbi:ATP-binding cassette, subfamily B [Ectothiorhodosinus mongolicus]|uniref:ATP-binding cassette, subfamily B n=1 Tax=Ectothiorhodosinus mongolicus TaxID=233100 RepID=A0A1R3VWU8_9GAMM|nr:ATP-binding cassette, subfamily B [Ectothiorhodosinus mongolicus]